MPRLNARPDIDYRPDIDGLRALAILPVVLFHAGVPGFAGGFVGVDVFFVISGFLITAIIDRELQAGRFSIRRFYERRARRILPALFVMLVCSSIFAALWLFPDQYLAYAHSLVAATLFVSSFLFRRENGYFDLASDEKPLLHTWSLSVEELYYVFFPMILLWAARLPGDRRRLALILIALVSFVASVIGLHQDPASKSVFFLPHFRAWEFLLGALIALSAPPLAPRQWTTELGAWLGLGLILIAVFGYSQGTVFPGVAALVPCVGTALVIACGRARETQAGRLLARPGIVFVGLISYSLYLWHWPLLVFARIEVGGELHGGQIASVLVLSGILAVVSWRYVERPFRGKQGWLSRRQIAQTALAVMLLFVGIGLHGILSQGWTNRYPIEVTRILFAANDKDPRLDDCLSVRGDAVGCLYGDPHAPPTLALWGDSHAFGYAAMLGELTRERGTSLRVFTMPACPPLVAWGQISQDWRDSCTRFQRLAHRQILDTPEIQTVLLAGNYTKYEDWGTSFRPALERVVDDLLAAGKEVVLIYPTPQLEQGVPELLSRKVLAGEMPTKLTQPRQAFESATQEVTRSLDRIAQHDRVLTIRPDTRLCDTRECYFYRDKTVYYYDDHHLSLSGAVYLRPLFEPLFARPK